MSTLGRVLGTASVVGGVIGAGVLGGMTAQRRALQRYRELDQISGWGPADGFDRQRSDRSYSVASGDGVALHVEEVGAEDAPLTVIFSHGWTLRSGSWYFQRAALDPHDTDGGARLPSRRLVFYDQRSHGRSSRSPEGHSTLDRLAADLAAVIATAAPQGPIVLIGHSMGGMAIMKLAETQPDLIRERVRGVALISTSATETDSGLRRLWQINGSNPLLPWITSIAARYPGMMERSRLAGGDAVWLATRSLGFADPSVPAPLVDYLDQMISATPVEVIADFAPALFNHDTTAGLGNLADIPSLIAVGEKDRMTPPSRAEALASALHRSELLVLPGAGHMAIMERPEEINTALSALLVRATSSGAAAGQGPANRRAPASRRASGARQAAAR